MTPLQLVTLVLYLAAAAVAARHARGDPRSRPVAVYLGAVVALDVLRYMLAAALPDASQGPPRGTALLLRHLSQGAYLGTIAAQPALAVALFFRRRPAPVALAAVLLWVVVVGAYPWLRGPALLELYSCAEVAGLVCSGAAFASWLRSPQLLEEAACPHIWAGLAILAGTGAVALIPRLTGAWLLASWPAVVLVNGAMVALAGLLLARRPSRCTRPS